MPDIIESAEGIEGAVRVSMDLYRTRVESTEPFIISSAPVRDIFAEFRHRMPRRNLRPLLVEIDSIPKPKRISNLYMLAAKEEEIRDKS